MSDVTSIISSALVGVFTLAGVWLKDHLDNKNFSRVTIRQKAMEAYSLLTSLNQALNNRTVYCKSLIEGGQISYSEFSKSYPDTSFDILERLELLIIENFSDLEPEFDEANKIVTNHSIFLLRSICNLSNGRAEIDNAELETKHNDFITQIIGATLKLKDELNKKYINVSPQETTFTDYLESIKLGLKKFFR